MSFNKDIDVLWILPCDLEILLLINTPVEDDQCFRRAPTPFFLDSNERIFNISYGVRIIRLRQRDVFT